MSSYQPSEFILGGDFLDDIGTTGDMRLPTPRNEAPPPNRTVHHQPRGPRYDSYRAQNSSFHQGGQQQSTISRQPNPMYYNNAPRKGMQQVNNTMLNQMLNTTRGNFNWNNSSARGRNEHVSQQRVRQQLQHQVETKVAQQQQQQQAFRFSAAQQQQQQLTAGKVSLTPQQQQMLQQQQRIQQQQHMRQQQLVQQQQQSLHQIRSTTPQRAPSPMFQQSQRQQHNFTTSSPLMPAMRPPTPVQMKHTPPPAQPSPKLPAIASPSRSSSPDVEIISTINVPDKPPSRGNFIVQPSPPPSQPIPTATSRAQKNIPAPESSDVEIIMSSIRPSNIIIKEKRTSPPVAVQIEKESRTSPIVAAPKAAVEPAPSPKQVIPPIAVEEEIDFGIPRLDCQLCPFFTTVIQQLDAHMYLTHQHRFKCKLCNFYVSSTYFGHLHWLLEHPLVVKQKPEMLLLSLKPGPHFRHSELLVCLFCHHIVPNRAKLEAHFLTTHPSLPEQVYVSYPLEDRNSPPILASNTAFNKENTYCPRYVYECDFCEGTFLSILLLRIHFMERHPDIMPKFTTIPNKDKLSIQALNQKAIGTGQFSCSKCLATEDSEENLSLHQYICQKGNYKCSCCEFWATSESDIKKHHSKKHKELYFSIDVRRSLTRNAPLDKCSRYKCFYCTFFCFNSREMIYHCQKMHLKRQLPFKYYIFSSTKEEEPYLIEKSVFKCAHCDVIKPDIEETVKEHSLKSHGEEKIAEVPLNKELANQGLYNGTIWQIPYSCTFCKSKFQNLLSCYHHHFLWHPTKFFPFPLDGLVQKSLEGTLSSTSKRGRPKSKKKEEELLPDVKKEASDASALQKFNINKDVVIVLEKLKIMGTDMDGGEDLLSDDTEVQAESDSTVIQGEDNDYEMNDFSISPSSISKSSPKRESPTLDEKPPKTLKRKKSVTLSIAEESLNNIVGTVLAKESSNEEQRQVPKTILKISKANLLSSNPEWKISSNKEKIPELKKLSKKRKRAHSIIEDNDQETSSKAIALESLAATEETSKNIAQEKSPLRKCPRRSPMRFKDLKLKSLVPSPQSRQQIIAANFLVRKYQKIREEAALFSRELDIALEKSDTAQAKSLNSEMLPSSDVSDTIKIDKETDLLNKGSKDLSTNKDEHPSLEEIGSSIKNPDENAPSKINPQEMPSAKSPTILPKGISLIPLQTSPQIANNPQQCSSEPEKLKPLDSVNIEAQSIILPKLESSIDATKSDTFQKSLEAPELGKINGKITTFPDEDSLPRPDDNIDLEDEEEDMDDSEPPQPEINTASIMSQLKGIQIIPIAPAASAISSLPASITLTPAKTESSSNNMQGLSIQLIPSTPSEPSFEKSHPSTQEASLPKSSESIGIKPTIIDEKTVLGQPSNEKEKLPMSDSEIEYSDEEDLLGKESVKEIPQESEMDEEEESREEQPNDKTLLQQFPNLRNLQITMVEQAPAAQEDKKPIIIKSEELKIGDSDSLQITSMDDKNSKDSFNPGLESTDDLSSINTFSDSSQDSFAHLSDVSVQSKKELRKSSKCNLTEKNKKKLKVLENLRCTKALRSRSLDRAAKRVSIEIPQNLDGKRKKHIPITKKRTPPVKKEAVTKQSSIDNINPMEKILMQDNLVVTPTAYINSLSEETSTSEKDPESSKIEVDTIKVASKISIEKSIRSSFYPPLQTSPVKVPPNLAPSPSKSILSESDSPEITCNYCNFKGHEKGLDQHMVEHHHFYFKCATCKMHFDLPYLSNHHHSTERTPTIPHHILPLEGTCLDKIEDTTTEKCICEICHAELSSYRLLRSHFEENHPAQVIKFIQVLKDGEFPSLLTEELYSCSICEKFVSTYVEVVYHCRESHCHVDTIPTLHKGLESFDRYYSCDYCDFTTGSSKLIDVHWDLLHPDRPAKSYSIDSESPECPMLANKNRKCKRCSFRAATPDEVRAHFYLTHLGIFRCGSCTMWKKKAVDVEAHFAQNHPGEAVTLLVRNKLALSSCIPAVLCDRLKCAYCIFFCFNVAEMRFHHSTYHAPRTLPLNYINFDAKGTYAVIKKDLFRCQNCPDSPVGFSEDLSAHTSQHHQLEKITEDEEDIIEELAEGIGLKCQLCSFTGASLTLLHHHHLCFHPHLPFHQADQKEMVSN